MPTTAQITGHPAFATLPKEEQDKALARASDAPAPERGFLSKAAEAAPPIIGGTIGALAGIPAGPPGMIGGAALGAGAGEAFGQLGQRAGIIPGQPPQTSAEAAKDIGIEAAIGGAGEGIGGAAIKGLGALGRKIGPTIIPSPFRKSITKEGKEALELIEQQTGRKSAALPSQVTDSAALDVITNVVENSIYGRSAIVGVKKGSRETMNEVYSGIVEKMAKEVDPDVLGHAFLEGSKKTVGDLKKPARDLYKYIDQRTPLINISTKGLKADLKTEMRILRETSGIGGEVTGASILKKIEKMPASVKMDSLISLRQSIGDIGSAPNMAPRAKKVMADLGSKVDKIIEAKLGKNQQLIKSYRDANEIWKHAESFNTDLMKTIKKSIAKEPDKAADMLFRKRSGVRVDQARALIGEKDWPVFKRSAIESAWAKASKKGGFKADDFHEQLYGTTGYGEKVMEKIYSKAENQRIKEFAGAFRTLEAKQAEGAGGAIATFIQPAALGTIAGGLIVGDPISVTAGTAVFLAPKLVGEFMANETGQRLLLEGIKTPVAGRGTQTSLSLISRVKAHKAVVERKLEKEKARNEGTVLSNLPQLPNQRMSVQ